MASILVSSETFVVFTDTLTPSCENPLTSVIVVKELDEECDDVAVI